MTVGLHEHAGSGEIYLAKFHEKLARQFHASKLEMLFPIVRTAGSGGPNRMIFSIPRCLVERADARQVRAAAVRLVDNNDTGVPASGANALPITTH
ncbi:hypothetical protein [Burkholderia sp. YIM B11467]